MNSQSQNVSLYLVIMKLVVIKVMECRMDARQISQLNVQIWASHIKCDVFSQNI